MPSGKKVVCYFYNEAHNNKGKGKFTPDDIDASLCTHVVYAFANLDPNKHVLTISNYTTDITDGEYIISCVYLSLI